MTLAKRLINQAGFDFLQQVQKLVFSTILNIVVINFLPRENYALFGIAAGYFVFLQWVSFTPETILIQRYEKIKNNNWANFIATMNMFGLLRSIGIFFISIILATILYVLQKNLLLSLAITLYSLYQALMMNSGSLQFILKMSFKQENITRATLILNILKIVVSFILLIYPNVLVYILLLLVFSFIEIVVWLLILRSETWFPLTFSIRKTWNVSKEYLYSFSIWQQLSGIFSKTMYQVDTFFLSLAGVALLSIGNYTVALQIANLAFIIPNLLQASLSLWLSRISNKSSSIEITNLYLKYSLLISIFQLLAFALFGKWYILLYSREYVEQIYSLSLIIIVGTTIINVVRPLISLSNARLNVKKLLLYAHLPSTLFSLICYYISSKMFGVYGVAYANIIIYLFWACALVIYTYKNGYSFSLNLKITNKEKNTILEIINNAKNKTLRKKTIFFHK